MNVDSGLKVRGKSALEQSITDCSVFKDNKYQGDI